MNDYNKIKEEIIQNMYNFDFKSNSAKEFSRINKISYKTVINYLKQYNIPYNSNNSSSIRKRDVSGKFCYNQINLDKDIKKDEIKKNIKKNNKNYRSIENRENFLKELREETLFS